MKIISRATAVAVSATAAVAFLAPAANASSSDSRGQLQVCAFGLDSGDEVEVDIWGRGDWSGDLRGCKTFRARSGVYSIDIDVPDGYRIKNGDDDRTVRVHSGERTTVRFWLDETDDGGDGWNGDECDDNEDDDCEDGWNHDGWNGNHDGWNGNHDGWNGHHDGAGFVRVDEDGDCPNGYERSRVNDEICIRD